MAMELCFQKNPLDVIRLDVAFVQRWWPLLEEADQTAITSFGEKMKTWLHNFTPSKVAVSDIMELGVFFLPRLSLYVEYLHLLDG